jgi:thiamine-monophosphate kinase
MTIECFLKDLGEKRVISEIILPLINPKRDKNLAGDDCATIQINDNTYICASTDRVPSDLISFKLGIIDYFQLGYYLAVLNISDIYACGATPQGLLLNFAFPGEFGIDNLNSLLRGIKKACDDYECKILGGDLSDSVEMNLTATSIGICNKNKPIYRSKCAIDDIVYCSDFVGLTPTAFLYFLEAKGNGLFLSKAEEDVLKKQFTEPKARKSLSRSLLDINQKHMVTCMDNTDGIYQSLYELCCINTVSMELYSDKLPIHDVSYKVTELLGLNIFDVVLAAGADFQLVGTMDNSVKDGDKHHIYQEGYNEIGIVRENTDSPNVYLNEKGQIKKLNIPGWNYYTGREGK